MNVTGISLVVFVVIILLPYRYSRMNIVKDLYPYFECLNTLNGHLDAVTFVAFGLNNRFLVSGSLKTIKVWNLETRQEITTLIKGGCSNIDLIALSPDKQTLVCNNGKGIIKVWNLKSGQKLRTFKAHSEHVISTALYLSPVIRLIISTTTAGIW